MTKHPRRARRLTLRLATCAGIGAAVTVGVSWGIAAFGEQPWQASFNSSHETIKAWPRAVPDGWPTPTDRTWARGGAWLLEYFHDGYDRGHSNLILSSYGWPAFAMEERMWADAEGRSTKRAIRISDERGLPPFPRFPGFIINTATYALAAFALSFVLGLPRAIRRHRRRARGRCPSCNYDLSGLSPGSPCPECAAAPPAKA